MDQQQLCINAATGEVSATNVSAGVPALSAILGTLFVLRVTFESDNMPVALAAGTTGKLSAKVPGQEDGPAILLDAAWTASGSGAQTAYTFSVLADNVQLRTALGGSASLALTAQVEWQLAAESEPRRSVPFPIVVSNSPSREEDGAPDPAANAAWDWIKARLVAGSNVTFSYNEGAKTITVNAAGAAAVTSVAWAEVTGKPSTFPSTWSTVVDKPSTFPPSTHSHGWSQITSGSPSDNAALVSFVQSNAGTGQMFDLLLPLEVTDTDTYDSLTDVLKPLVFPRDAVITHIGLAVSTAVPRAADNFWQANLVVYVTSPPDYASVGDLYATSFWYYETFPTIDGKGLGIPLMVNGSLSITAGSKLDLYLDTGAPDAYATRPTFQKLWLRVRGRYTN